MSFAIGLLILVLVMICVLALVKRYVYPLKAEQWRHSTGIKKGLSKMYDWMDGEGTAIEVKCKDRVVDMNMKMDE